MELHLEASWSLCWRQDGPSGAKMGQVGTKLAVKFGKLRTKRRILYIYKLPINRKAATMLFEGVCVNYHHPGPQRGEPRVGSAPDVAFPANRADPVDPVQNSGRLKNPLFLNCFWHFLLELGIYFWP